MDHEHGTDAMEQLQAAALDAVRAARALLDAAESVIKDPAAVESVVESVTNLARSAGETVLGFAAGAREAATGEPTPPCDDPSGDPGGDADGGYERIPVD